MVQMTSPHSGCCCCVPSSLSSAKVAPAPDSKNEIIEIRPKRYLRVQHLNPRPRDERFEREMQMFVEYRRHGMATQVLTTVYNKNERGKSPVIHLEKTKNHTHQTQNIPGVLISQDEKNDANHSQNYYNNHDANSQSQGQVTNVRTSYNIDKEKEKTSDMLDTKLHLNSGSLPPSRGSTRVPSVQSVSNVHVTVSDNQPKKLTKSQQPAIEEKDEQETPRTGRLNKNKTKSSTSEKSSVTSDKNNKKRTSLRNVDSVLFFIHGVGGSSNIWVSQIKHFSSLGYEIVCPDLIGHGLSSAPDDKSAYRFDEILEDIEELFDKYCKRSNFVIGHSYGCAFATVLARKRPRRVTKLVLVSGGAPIPLAPQPGVFTLPLCILNCLTPCISCTFKRNAFHKKTEIPVPARLAFDIPAYVLSYVMNGQEWPDGDEAIYGSKLEILENAGHMVMIEKPNIFNSCLQNFIEDENCDSDETVNQTARNDSTQENPPHLSNTSVNDSAGQISNRNYNTYDHQESTPNGRTTRNRAKSVTSEISYKSGKSSRSTKSMPRGLLSHHVK
ncbi:hypothetical protein KUTeg_017641 [Tegillarca granosa]|uniref:acylglycerol lipase n=1 Tax=Tegillarca granosa TaxID=220873 RepID=A0ABQ9EFH0_TEGGR|nr:hypothetical protein KUTeg_017641 [Tegillarca granosa]